MLAGAAVLVDLERLVLPRLLSTVWLGMRAMERLLKDSGVRIGIHFNMWSACQHTRGLEFPGTTYIQSHLYIHSVFSLDYLRPCMKKAIG